MKIDVDKLTKRYYTIGEVSELLDVNNSLLRYWETEFSKLSPKKKKGGVRLYTNKDISTINFIYDLLKVKGYTIEGAKKVLKSGTPVSKGHNQKLLDTAISKLENAVYKIKQLKKNLD